MTSHGRRRPRWYPLITALAMLLPARSFAEDPESAPRQRTYTFDDGVAYTYTRPTAFGWVRRGFTNLAPFTRNAFAADNLDTLAVILGSTALLVHYDQQIYEDVSAYGRRHGISQNAEGSSVLELPHDRGNYMYFIGDGRVPIAIATTLAVSGYLRDDLRQLSTASQLAEAMVSTGLICQGIKMALGRETPESRTEDGGDWHGPVTPDRYLQDQTRYDAMPSGHLATAVATMTVLAENYHEHGIAIYSTGGVLMGLLSFEMVNNGVHWAGDYPLGIAIGYAVGRLVARNNRTEAGPGERPVRLDLRMEGDALVLQASKRF